jgi:hypothetical protein
LDLHRRENLIPLHPENGGSMALRNVGILPQHYTASKPRRPRFESSPPWKPHISDKCFKLVVSSRYLVNWVTEWPVLVWYDLTILTDWLANLLNDHISSLCDRINYTLK